MCSEQATLQIGPHRHIEYLKKRCPGLCFCNHKYVIHSWSCASRTDPLSPSLFNVPVTFVNNPTIDQRRCYVPYSPIKLVKHPRCHCARDDKDVPKREKSIVSTAESQRERNRLTSRLKGSVLNDCADAAAALALQVSERIATTERPTFLKWIWQASVQEQIAGGAVRSICHSAYGFSNLLTLLARLLTKTSPP